MKILLSLSNYFVFFKQSKITLQGNRLIHEQRVGPVEAMVIREFNGKEMITTFVVGDTVATRVFKKVKIL